MVVASSAWLLRVTASKSVQRSTLGSRRAGLWSCLPREIHRATAARKILKNNHSQAHRHVTVDPVSCTEESLYWGREYTVNKCMTTDCEAARRASRRGVRSNTTTGHRLLPAGGLTQPVPIVSGCGVDHWVSATHLFQLCLVLCHELWVNLHLGGLERWRSDEIKRWVTVGRENVSIALKTKKP